MQVAVEPKHPGGTLYAWFAQQSFVTLLILDIFKLYLHAYAGAIESIASTQSCEVLIEVSILEYIWQMIRKFKNDP
ncbi:hypothetical protein D3C85_1577980 [compost metagenome]